MRTDPSKQESFQESEAWKKEELYVKLIQRSKPDDGDGPPFRAIPFSGRERNRLFLNTGKNFKDYTLVSGADFREDGRGFALFDYDKDGLLDMAISSPNTPKLRIVRNQMGELYPRTGKANFIKVDLIGGQTSAEPSTEWSPRDAFGATILVEAGTTKRIFQFSCSEGLSAQNSRLVHVGLGDSERVEKLTVNWPSGKKTVLDNVGSGQVVKVFENPDAQSNHE